MESGKLTFIPDEVVINKIYFINGHKVMIDRDLADLYGVETKRLKEAVRRNKNRFPSDFMFEMKEKESDLGCAMLPSALQSKGLPCYPVS